MKPAKEPPIHAIRAFVVAVFVALLFGAVLSIVVLPSQDRQRLFNAIDGSTRP